MNQPRTAEEKARIAARYPKRSTVDLLVFGAAVAALLTAIGLVVASGLVRANPPVVAMVRAFDVIDAHRTTVELVVQRTDPTQPATCALFAQAPNYEKVGELDVAVPPGSNTLTVMNFDIKTLHEATSVSVEGCELTS